MNKKTLFFSLFGCLLIGASLFLFSNLEEKEQTDAELVSEATERPLEPSISPAPVVLSSTASEDTDLLQSFQATGGQFKVENRELLLELLGQEELDVVTRIRVLREKGDLEWRNGLLMDAVASYASAWEAGKELTVIQEKRTAEGALARYADILARMGRRADLRQLVDSLGDRPLGGEAEEAVWKAKETLWFFENQAEQNVYCGFSAANAICVPEGHRPIFPDVHDEEERQEFIANGLSLYELRAHSHEKDGDLVIYKRTDPTAPLPVPSIVHWDWGHYSAITETLNGQYRIKDPHLKLDTLLNEQVIENDLSGYVLADASTTIPSGYTAVSDEEAKQVFGRHCVHGRGTEGSGFLTRCLSGKGMATYAFRLLNPGLELYDTPVSYTPPVGPEMAFKVEYDQRSVVIPDSPGYGNLGPRWTYNYLMYVDITGTSAPATSLNIIFGSGDYFT